MNEADNKVKAQIVEKIKTSTNILVTVSKDPSVDELSAALGLTALLNKIDKHATAIFSGAIPPAITFLEPDKVFENTADSLRDFIIALDKEKADHLRYKVEGDVVKIFITPYRTAITEKDLGFSQGDYNIELVLALGVENQEHLDTALAANGQILHDVSVATFSVGKQTSQLGSLDWQDQNASSLCEMVTNIGELLKTGTTALFDKQIATALLTGIVSATDRFSNPLTSSSVMTTAAQLMAAGADQQLIAAKLQESHEINSLPGASVDKIATASIDQVTEQSTLPPDVLSISHEPEAVVEVAPLEPETTVLPEPVAAEQPETTVPPVYLEDEPTLGSVNSQMESSDEPLLGGILNATSDQAAEDARKELDDMQNKTILSHSYLGGSGLEDAAPINGVGQTEDTKMVDIFADSPESTIEPTPPIVGLPLPPPLPDFSTLPPAVTPPPPAIPEASPTIMPEPTISVPTTALPDFSAPYSTTTPEATSTLPPEPDTSDPSKFQIPGQ